MRLLRTAAVGLAGALVLTGCSFDGAYDLPLPGSKVDKDTSFEVTAEFRDVLNVVPKSPVFVNDVPSGEVMDVRRVGWHAVVTMRINDDVKLPDNALAEIRQTSILGEKYVALLPTPGEKSRGRLGEGDKLSLQDTGRNPELEEILSAVAFLLQGGGISQIKTITTELNAAFDGRSEQIGHMLGELNTFVGALDEQSGDIIRALESIDRLTGTLNEEREVVGKALEEIGPAIEVLADQHDQLIRMLRSLNRLGVVGSRVVNATKDDLLATLRHLEPVLRKLNEAGQALPNQLDLIMSFPFPLEAADVVFGDYANTSIAMEIDLEELLHQILSGEEGSSDDFELPDLEAPTVPGLPSLPGLPGLGGRSKDDRGGGGGLLGGLLRPSSYQGTAGGDPRGGGLLERGLG